MIFSTRALLCGLLNESTGAPQSAFHRPLNTIRAGSTWRYGFERAATVEQSPNAAQAAKSSGGDQIKDREPFRSPRRQKKFTAASDNTIFIANSAGRPALAWRRSPE